MKPHTLPCAVVLAAAALLATPVSSSAQESSLGIAGIARYHQAHSAVRKWPFDKDDMSYGASLRIYDGMGYLEFGCEYAPEASADEVLDEVFTPFARLVVKDQGVVAGFGIRDNYVTFTDESRDDEWEDLLYEFHLGLEFCFGPISLGGGAYYSFDDWNDLKSFDGDDLEYGAHLCLSF